MNSKAQEYNLDIDHNENDENDNEELLALGIEIEEEEFNSLNFDSLDDEEEDTDNNFPGDAVPPAGGGSARVNSEDTKQSSEPQKPAVIKKAKRPEGNNNSFNPAPQHEATTAQSAVMFTTKPASERGSILHHQPSYTPIPQAQMEGLRNEMTINNTFSGYIESRERREKAELRVLDAQQQNIFRQQLAQRPIFSVPTDLDIRAEFPLAAFPSNMARIIREVADSLQVPIEAVGSALIGASSIAARGNFQINVKPGHNEALTTYIMVGLASGGRKSAIVGFFRRIFNTVEQELQIAFDTDATECMLTKDVLKSIKKLVQKEELATLLPEGALSYTETAAIVAEKLKSIQEDIDKVYWRPRFLVDSPTLKELAVAMGTQDEAIGIMEAEGGIWKNRVLSNVDDILLKGFTMEPFSDETSTAGSVILNAPCLSICSLVQMDVAETLYSRSKLKDHGVLPRILVVFAKWRGGPKRVDIPPISADATDFYEDKIRSLLNITRPEGQKGVRTWHTIELSSEARAALLPFEQEINRRIHEGHFANFESFGEKLIGHAIRLAGIVHLWEHQEPHADPIGDKAMQAGIQLARFYSQHAMAAFDLERLQGLKFAHKILNWIKREHIKFFSKRDAQRSIGRCQAQDIQAGIDQLEHCGILGQYVTSTHSLRCIVNPSFNPHAF